jgi:hypothetical protein
MSRFGMITSMLGSYYGSIGAGVYVVFGRFSDGGVRLLPFTLSHYCCIKTAVPHRICQITVHGLGQPSPIIVCPLRTK